MVNNIPVNGWPQLKDLEAVQPALDRLDKIEAWKRTVKEETFTGDDITIENALALPARSLITEINAIQEGEGDPSPTNIRPISGRTAVRIDQTGNAITFAQGGLQDNNGAEIASDARIRSDYIPHTNGEFTLSMVSGAENDDRLRNSIYLYDAQKQFIVARQYGLNPSAFPVDVNIDIPANTAYMRFVVQKENASANISPTNKVMAINNSIIIQLGTTVYGADINWDTGVATVLWAKIASMTRGSIDSSGKLYTLTFSGVTINPWGSSSSASSYIKCSHFKSMSLDAARTSGDKCIVQYYNGLYIGGYVGAENDLDTLLASGNLDVIYELATPTTIQLTPTQLEMLKGYNHITLSDGYGTIELKALTGANWS